MSSAKARAMRIGSHPRSVRRIREPVAGQRRHDEVEFASQLRDHVEELDDRPGPAVDQQQRERVRRRVRARAGSGSSDAVDARPELGERVDARFLGPPVVPVAPVLDQLAAGIRSVSRTPTRFRRSRRESASDPGGHADRRARRRRRGSRTARCLRSCAPGSARPTVRTEPRAPAPFASRRAGRLSGHARSCSSGGACTRV